MFYKHCIIKDKNWILEKCILRHTHKGVNIYCIYIYIYIYLKRRLVLTVGDTFILDFKVLICSWAGVRKNIWSSDDDALRSIVTPGWSERKIEEI